MSYHTILRDNSFLSIFCQTKKNWKAESEKQVELTPVLISEIDKVFIIFRIISECLQRAQYIVGSYSFKTINTTTH